MKTPFYVGTVVKAYREAIDDYFDDPALYEKKIPYYLEEISKASHREYTTGFYYGKPGGTEQNYTSNSYLRGYDFIGMIQEDSNADGYAWMEQRNKFSVGEIIEIMKPDGRNPEAVVEEIRNEEGELMESAPHPQQKLRVKLSVPAEKYDILRRKE